jgi:hypothetical protein
MSATCRLDAVHTTVAFRNGQSGEALRIDDTLVDGLRVSPEDETDNQAIAHETDDGDGDNQGRRELFATWMSRPAISFRVRDVAILMDPCGHISLIYYAF